MAKIKLQIKSIFGKLLFEYEKEDNTMKETVERALADGSDLTRADLRWANLRWANLTRANLTEADLRWANLRWANLTRANLRWANLTRADLRWANLTEANLDKRYISITRIGSRNSLTTYCFEDDIIWCGCFKGTLKQFEAKVKETHANNPQYLKEYLGWIEYVKSLKE